MTVYEKFESGVHWKKFRLFRIEKENGGGFLLYTRKEWETYDGADTTADAKGNIRFQTRPTGEQIPAAIRRRVRCY